MLLVVGTDGSENAAAAMSWVADFAGRVGARVVAVHTFEPLVHLGDAPPPVDFSALRQKALDRLLHDWCSPLRALPVEFEALVLEGDPAQVLADVADERDADLIVVGKRGLNVVKSLLLGSTSTRLAQISTRPVVIVPTRGDPRTGVDSTTGRSPSPWPMPGSPAT